MDKSLHSSSEQVSYVCRGIGFLVYFNCCIFARLRKHFQRFRDRQKIYSFDIFFIEKRVQSEVRIIRVDERDLSVFVYG